MPKFVERKGCPKCLRVVAFKKDGEPYKHTCEGDLNLRCEGCRKAFVPRDGQIPEHDCVVSDPAPTVDDMDDEIPEPHDAAKAAARITEQTPATCREATCTCEGHGGPEHELASIGWSGAPAPAEVSYWQRQARDAAARHMETSENDTPYVALLKEELSVPDAFTGPAEPTDSLPVPDPFTGPAEPEVKLNVSGQPPARRDYLKRYLVVDPDLGDFRRTKKERKPVGITRATTFNKHAQNTIALNGWSKRNVVMGASLRPDILRRAHGLNHENGKQELDRIVDELETAAGAKVAADEGTFLHEFCDQVDAGLKTWQDAPPAYQQDIKRYVEALETAGLEPVPGLIERTTFIREHGGVCGTFDRIFYHRPSDQYIVGDLKTGKTMKYAMDETECQIWTYAHGVNQTGIYDWHTDTWCSPGTYGDSMETGPWQVPTVSETVGVIVHMPVQGPEAGEVYLRFANLERGRAYAELNNAVKSYEKSKVLPFEMPATAAQEEPWTDIGGGVEVRHSLVDVPAPAPRFKRNRTTGPWLDKFSTVATREEANRLYKEAKAAGLSEAVLKLCVDLGKDTLSGVDTD